MIYQIVSPVVQTINGDSLKDAIKNFVKINDMYSLNKLIVTDQQNAYYNANINYYKNKYNKNKASINISRNIDNVGWNVYPKNEPGFLLNTPLVTPIISNNSGFNPIVTAPGKIAATSNGAVIFPNFYNSIYPV
jgi:hypothetical protein